MNKPQAIAHHAAPRRSRRRLALSGLAALCSVGVAASLAVADAHIYVRIDAFGETTTVRTTANTVAGVLASAGIELELGDTVYPGLDSPARHGTTIEVRFGHTLPVEVDGEEQVHFVPALDAGEALTSLAAGGREVRLIASRGGGRADVSLPLDVEHGPIAVVADGQTKVVQYGGGGIDAVLLAAEIDLSLLDHVSVVDVHTAGVTGTGAAGLAIIVERVVTEDLTEVTVLPYTSQEVEDAERFDDLPPIVRQQGVEGTITRTLRLRTVDGVETDRIVLSTETVAPVDHIVAVGTRERPPPAPGTPGGGAIPESVWVALAQCESGGRQSVISSNGLWHGLYQFRVDTWQSVGGVGLPSDATPAEQRLRAEILQARSGWGQWPACARRLGLL
ncbi:MAG: transglycosylase family protein [Promicromonosporaceae bacterium]|nr:transglycosylase family protein [Promicromonosporaceae bacterium]